jgi:hypothetical protein
MIHRTLPHTRVSRRPHHPNEHLRRNSGGGTSADAGGTAACMVWLPAGHPYLRVPLLFLPTYCPRVNPSKRAHSYVHDYCTRHHQCTRLLDLTIVGRRPQPHTDRRGPVVLAIECIPGGVRLSAGDAGPEARRPRAPAPSRAHHRAGPYLAALAAGPPEGYAARLWLVAHAGAAPHWR